MEETLDKEDMAPQPQIIKILRPTATKSTRYLGTHAVATSVAGWRVSKLRVPQTSTIETHTQEVQVTKLGRGN